VVVVVAQERDTSDRCLQHAYMSLGLLQCMHDAGYMQMNEVRSNGSGIVSLACGAVQAKECARGCATRVGELLLFFCIIFQAAGATARQNGSIRSDISLLV
jgi:hypothetical protein